MELGSPHDEEGDLGNRASQPRELPPDLPKTLDDRQNLPSFSAETEIYDAWQGATIVQLLPVEDGGGITGHC